MITRIVLILVCILIFINSCNSLISRVAGTHKLRTFTFDQVLEEGIGDADFIQINQAWSDGDYWFEPHKNVQSPGFVQFPVLTKSQYDSVNNGQQVTISVIGWTQRYEENCIEKNNCVLEGQTNFIGLVRPFNKRYRKFENFPKEKYAVSVEPLFVEYQRQPLDWYWNLAIMIASIIGIIALERWLNSRKKTK
ncbi:MAG: hypothetical protein AAFO07_28820 [Bacteroidota bacterium]